MLDCRRRIGDHKKHNLPQHTHPNPYVLCIERVVLLFLGAVVLRRRRDSATGAQCALLRAVSAG